jgi:hypothetical protein
MHIELERKVITKIRLIIDRYLERMEKGASVGPDEARMWFAQLMTLLGPAIPGVEDMPNQPKGETNKIDLALDKMCDAVVRAARSIEKSETVSEAAGWAEIVDSLAEAAYNLLGRPGEK